VSILYLPTGNKLFFLSVRVCVCDVVDWPCGSSPCQHGGTCVPDTDNNNYTCGCPPTHWGDRCERGIGVHTFKLFKRQNACKFLPWTCD